MLRFPSPCCRHDGEERPRRRKVQESPLDRRQRHGYLHSHRVSVPGLHLPLFVNVFLHASADPGLFPTIPPVYSHTPPFQLSAFYPHSFLAHPKPWHRAVVLFPRGFDLRSAFMSRKQMTCREFIPKDAVVDYDNLQLSLKVRRASPFCHSKLQISWVLFSSADLFANAFLPRFFLSSIWKTFTLVVLSPLSTGSQLTSLGACTLGHAPGTISSQTSRFSDLIWPTLVYGLLHS